MSLIRWDPFSDMDTLVNRMMSANLARWPRLLRSEEGGKVEWSPSADISETDKEYVIRAELPAVKKEDVKVTFADGMISISGERKQQKEDKNEKYHRIESYYGSFVRQFSLPENVDESGIRCDSQDGVLTVHIPKKTVEKSKQIEIKVQ